MELNIYHNKTIWKQSCLRKFGEDVKKRASQIDKFQKHSSSLESRVSVKGPTPADFS